MNAFAREAEARTGNTGALYRPIEADPKEIRAHLEWIMRPTPNDDALIEIAFTDPHEDATKYARLFAWMEFDAAVEFVIARNNDAETPM